MGLLFWGSGTPTFWLGLLLFTKRESRTPTFKILVRTLHQDLSWKKHIETTVNKANKTLGFVRPNLSDCSSSVKSATYTTTRDGIHLIRSKMYTIWNKHNAEPLGFPTEITWKYTRMCGLHGTEPWLGVHPTDTIHQQTRCFVQDPA